MKIHIVGGPGSGKSYLAQQMAAKWHIPHCDLDDVNWDNQADAYGTKRDVEERQALLAQVLAMDDWVIEGAYFTWCRESFAQADAIIVLSVPPVVYRHRIIRRFVRRKLGLERGKKETLRSLVDLLRWADDYRKVKMAQIQTLLSPYADKLALGRRLADEVRADATKRQPPRPYYGAYDERYKVIHAHGGHWTSDTPTPIVMQTIVGSGLSKDAPMLEIGCGEGRDAHVLLEQGYHLTATDVSPEAIAYCRRTYPDHAAAFATLDCLSDTHEGRYAFVYAVAVVHMLVLDEDRQAMYRFVRDHLQEEGVALLCAMGDGRREMRSDISQAYCLQPRRDRDGRRVMVAETSCCVVTLADFVRELSEAGLEVAEAGLTQSPPEFDLLEYAVVRRAR